jgi:hypothetical protein
LSKLQLDICRFPAVKTSGWLILFDRAHILAEISKALEHQGPDGEFLYEDGSIALLYRPFHTTAESRRETQPYVSRGGFILTWDGRLDNRDDLIGELKGDLEAEPTDVAIVAAGFERWETDCLRRIVGDWAVSVWKPDQRELILAIDYIAIRHLFYHSRNDQIRWSTELSPLVLSSGIKFRIDDDYIAGYFAHEPDAHLTPYREISEVPPGHFVRIRGSVTSVERYWRFVRNSRLRYKTDKEYEEHFRQIFRQSVGRRLRSDSRILAELSGGLDSSSNLPHKQRFSCNCQVDLGFNRVIQTTRHSPTSRPLLAFSEVVMPAIPKPRSENEIHRIASWRLLTMQFRRWGFQKYSLKLLIGIRTVLNRHSEGFDWKEIAVHLHVGGTSLNDAFWREIRRADLSEKALQYGSAGSHETNPPDSLNLRSPGNPR